MLYEQPRLYDALYGQFADDVPFYIDIARAAGGAVLELAAGSGRVAVPLAAAGISVTGIDTSAAMIAAAQDRAVRAGVGDLTTFLPGDMRDPPPGPFAAVIIPLHSLSHLTEIDDLIGCLSAVHDRLVPGGRLAVALHNPDPVVLSGDPDALTRVHREISEVAVYETARYRSAEQILELKWYIETAEQTSLFAYELRMIYPQELLLLLRQTGFALEARYGWYDRRPFEDGSGTQVVVARRR